MVGIVDCVIFGGDVFICLLNDDVLVVLIVLFFFVVDDGKRDGLGEEVMDEEE